MQQAVVVEVQSLPHPQLKGPPPLGIRDAAVEFGVGAVELRLALSATWNLRPANPNSVQQVWIHM